MSESATRAVKLRRSRQLYPCLPISNRAGAQFSRQMLADRQQLFASRDGAALLTGAELQAETQGIRNQLKAILGAALEGRA